MDGCSSQLIREIELSELFIVSCAKVITWWVVKTIRHVLQKELKVDSSRPAIVQLCNTQRDFQDVCALIMFCNVLQQLPTPTPSQPPPHPHRRTHTLHIDHRELVGSIQILSKQTSPMAPGVLSGMRRVVAAI